MCPSAFEGVVILSFHTFSLDLQIRVSGYGGWFLLRLSLHDPVLPLNIEVRSQFKKTRQQMSASTPPPCRIFGAIT